jgi:chromosome segregation ATPase
MKTKVIIIVLVLIAVGLMCGLLSVKETASVQHKDDLDKISYNSNQWAQTSAKLDDEKQLNVTLQKDIDTRKDEATKLSNDLSQATESLTKSEAELKAQKEETAKRDAKITELESQNQELDKKATDLTTQIAERNTQIDDIKQKLAASEGDKTFLTKELNRLMAEKAEMERQFNDLAVLKAQVSKIKAEMTAAKRLQWIRDGVFARENEKGAQRLMQGASSRPLVSAAPVNTNAADLNVEVNSDGSVKVIAPVTNTSAPPGK